MANTTSKISQRLESFQLIMYLTLERPSKISSVVDQPGLVGPLSSFYAMDLLNDEYSLYVCSFKGLIVRIYVLKHIG